MLKITMPVLLYLIVSVSWFRRKIHTFQRQNIKAKLIKNMCMHVLIMTLNKLNNVNMSVFCNDNAP